MGDKTYDIINYKQLESITIEKRALLINATLSDSDSITVLQLTTVDNAVAFFAETGFEVTVTIDGTKITVDESAFSDENIVFLVIGAK